MLVFPPLWPFLIIWEEERLIWVDGGWIFGFSMIRSFREKLEIGPREQTRTTSLPSNSGCIWADALIRLVNILIELKARTKPSVLVLSLYLSLCTMLFVLLHYHYCRQLLWFLRHVKSHILVNLCGCTAQQDVQYSGDIYGFNWIILCNYGAL